MVSESMQELRDKCSKNYYDPYVKKLHYTLLYFTQFLLKTNITPNQITVFWLFLQLGASLLMIYGTYWLNVLGIVLYTIAGFLDAIDGQIARIKKKSTYKGIFLEWLGVCFGSPVLFICFSIGVSVAYNNLIYIVFGVISALALLLSKLIVINPDDYKPEFREKLLSLKNNLSMRNKNKRFAWVYLLTRRSNPFNLLFIGIILGFPRETLILYTALYVLELFRRLFTQLRTLYKLDKELLKEERKRELNL
ncbi:MAG: CDP-alcohol phosphatidyltransferase family protein [Nanoarchaeota archaeon]